MDIRFQVPSTILISGPSQAGKTCFVEKLIRYRDVMFSKRFTSILWCYGAVRPVLQVCKSTRIRFMEGLPDNDALHSIPSQSLVIIDDLMGESGHEVANMFTKYSHHKNMTIIFIVQNLFYQGKRMRDISLNAHYIVCFKNPRDRNQIYALAKQLYPISSKQMVQAYFEPT